MARPTSHTSRLHRTKAALLAVSLTLAGIMLMMLSAWLAPMNLGHWNWLHTLPLGELGGTLFGAGLLGTLFDYYARKVQTDLMVEQMDAVIEKHVPAIRDAVVESFAIDPDDLKRVATPELLDDLATNAMALRLGDDQFARELYTDIRDQAIRASERWHDVNVRIRLSSIDESSTYGAALFDVLVEWEYTTVPSHSVRRFACVSDRDEFNELVSDTPSTSTWFMRKRPGMDASSRESYELLSFTVDGKPRSIRRSGRKTGQTYTVAIGDDIVAAGEPVRIKHVFRTITPQISHGLFIELPQPTRGLAMQVDYTDTDIDDITVVNLLSARGRAPIERMPSGTHARVVSIEMPGWLLPGAGLGLNWTLANDPPDESATREHAA